MSEIWTIRRVLQWTTERFQKLGIDSPRLTSEILLAHVLQIDRVRLYVDFDRPLSKKELGAFRSLVERRSKREPTQYITGYREFYNRRLKVDDRVLIPRPETELLIDELLRVLPKERPVEILDVCTGSGCIAVTLAAELPLASLYATDLSPSALEVARQNAAQTGVADRVQLMQGDLFDPLPTGLRFDAVVSNPPYVATGELDRLQPEVLREPRVALDGGLDGLSVLRAITEAAPRWLKPGGFLALEISDLQGDNLRALFSRFGYRHFRIVKDLSRLDRLALAETAPLEADSPARAESGA